MVYQLQNKEIYILIDSLGAELRSLVEGSTGREYMWSGDGAYWPRVSPVLFPVIGRYRDHKSRYQGRVFEMPAHGFARDMEFVMTEQTEEEIWFRLTDNEESRTHYPFAFLFEIGYRLKGRSVEALWRVTNPTDETMYFSLGGHPAFLVPRRMEEKTTCYIRFADCDNILTRRIQKGLATHQLLEIPLLDGGLLPVTEEVFAGDALVLENRQTGLIELLDEEKNRIVAVSFDSPLVGVWTPTGKNAPLICIEPWYGRCDMEDFEGDLSQREWGNTLQPKNKFEASYTIML